MPIHANSHYHFYFYTGHGFEHKHFLDEMGKK